MRRDEFAEAPSGFSLVELMVVIVILGILSSLASINIIRMVSRAQEAAIKSMAHNVSLDLTTEAYKYDLNTRFTTKLYDENYLNGKLEKMLENRSYDNYYGYQNPFSKSKAIVNSGSVPGNLQSPAVFITNATTYSYSGIGSRTVNELRGSVVAYMRNGVQEVDVFYVDVKGKRSALRYTIG
jgi:prepilin-type N-terminal cleavage/methylation domain-containing protein